MLKFYLAPNLMILGTAFLLLAVSLSANSASSYAADTTYVAPQNSPSVRSLGQMDQGSVNMPPASAPAPIVRERSAADDTSTDTLQPVQSGSITYITGGIGDEERSTLQGMQKEYNLRVMNATHDGAFVGDTHVIILDHNGGELANTPAGPLFYAKLPEGLYTLQVSRGDVTKEQKVTIHHGNAALVHLNW